MTRNEHQRLNEQAMLHRQICWLSGMLTLARNALRNYQRNEGAAFKNGVECLFLMAHDVYLSDRQRSTLVQILDLSKRRPEALRGITGVIRQFLRPLNQQVLMNGGGFRQA